MNNFDLLYKKLMESMVAGGAGSVFGSPASGEVGAAGGAVGVNDDKAYAPGDNRMPHLTFKKVQRRPNINKKSKKKN
jgi:hypothetical protein